MIYHSKIFNRKNDAKAIYGIILIQALLLNYDNPSATPFDIAVKTFFGALLIVVAEIYSEFLGGTIKKGGRVSRKEIKKISHESFVISLVSVSPTIIFLLSSLHLFNIRLAFNLAYIIGLTELFIFGYLASFSATKNKLKSFRFAFMSLSFGMAIILSKNYLSHF